MVQIAKARWKVKKDLPIVVSQLPVLISYSLNEPDIKYLTIRSFTLSEEEFKQIYDSLTWKVRTHLIKEPHMERVLMDTNIDLDKGWHERTS